MTEEQQSEYVDSREACKILGISRATLDKYVRDGLISRYQQYAPKRTVYKRSDIEALKQIRPKNK